MKNIFRYLLSATMVLTMAACNDDEILDSWLDSNPPAEGEVIEGDPGTLDLSKYVALGNSLTAGYTDGALYPLGQANSYPSILARQFAYAGGGVFNQPNISSGNGFGGLNGDMSVRGKAYIDVAAALSNPANAIQFTAGSALTANTQTSLNNFGVPGARIVDATNSAYGHPTLGNPFFANFASSPGTSSMLADAVAANPTFFSVWLGNNDVLGYATGGGVDEAQITSQGNFQTALGTILTGLSAGGAKGVVLNVPPVHLAPYFQIVTTLGGGVNLIPLTDANTVATLNGAFNFDIGTALTDGNAATNPGYNSLLAEAVAEGSLTQAEADRREISWAVGANPPMITDESLTAVTVDLSEYVSAPPGSVMVSVPRYRQAEVNAFGQYDLFPLPALSVIGTLADPGNPNSVYGVGVALPDQYTLTISEQVNVITAYATFNATIDGVLASFPNVKLVDVRPMFADLFGLSEAQASGLVLGSAAEDAADGQIGITVDGYTMVPLDLGDNLFNSIWSADGIHPNQRGAALIANEIIKVLNAQFGAQIPMVDVLSYASINAVLP